ncbi:Imm1 family immunity protein [Allokutzneria sp. A3M-2-11 16]|uniref:Imm1 family immunity protein n=1 Tax=Allokutzneria sp. A3M-2-11 16 TaxID=2962043 RepID=UPI0020B7FAB7|nr:Imm1 family immunity protein [Allokutzneria sp. A3M-2-11 16]MCP3804726.1 Imm1 family immunity protein [Allokutzneria sp. A3M-2-11 16]
MSGIDVMWRTPKENGLETVRVVVETPDDVRAVLRRLEDEKALDASAVHRDRPRVPPRDIPDHTVLFGVRDQVGAIMFSDRTGSWATLGDGPDEEPVYAEIEFPSRCEIPVHRVEAALTEFLRTHQRPTVVDWQPVAE